MKKRIAYTAKPANFDIGVARLIVETVMGRKLTPDEVVHHIDGNHYNNKRSNLLVCTAQYHMWLHGQARIKRNNDKYARRVRKLFLKGYSGRQIARELGITLIVVQRIQKDFGLTRSKSESERLKWRTQKIVKKRKYTRDDIVREIQKAAKILPSPLMLKDFIKLTGINRWCATTFFGESWRKAKQAAGVK